VFPGSRRVGHAGRVGLRAASPTIYPEIVDLIEGLIARQAAHLPLH